jgi:predicted metal-binding membrane protein
VIAGAGYVLVWALVGAVVYPFGVFVAKAGMSSAELSRSMPIAAGIVLLLAGGLQLTAWKARQLCRCQAVIWVSGEIFESAGGGIGLND